MNETKSQEFRFNIQKPAEAPQFEDDLTQNFFRKWLSVNDSIEPHYISREEWKKRSSNNYLEKQKRGKQILYLPTDLKLWEITDVVAEIDKSSFPQNREKQQSGAESIRQFGTLLADTAAYIFRFAELESDSEALSPEQQMLKALAEDLFAYAVKVESSGDQGHVDSQVSADIRSREVTDDRVKEIDEWLAGDDLNIARKIRAEKQGQSLDEMRKATLLQFARVMQHANELDWKSWKGQLKDAPKEHPWTQRTPMHRMFRLKIQQLMNQAIEKPRTELISAISRRGLENLLRGITDRTWKAKLNEYAGMIGLRLPLKEASLYEQLNISQLKQELDQLREAGDKEKLARKELDIAIEIQRKVSQIRRESNYDSPSLILSEQTINCVGATSIAGAMLRELGIQYLVLTIPLHSVTLLLTSDSNVYWMDYLFPQFNTQISDGMMKGEHNGHAVSTHDITRFSQDKTQQRLNFVMDASKFPHDGQLVVDCFRPEVGEQIQLLGNIMIRASQSKENALAAESMRKAEQLTSESYIVKIKKARSFINMGIYDYAIENAQEALRLQPLAYEPYDVLGSAYLGANRLEDAKKVATVALEKFPLLPVFYFIRGMANFYLDESAEAKTDLQKYLEIVSPNKSTEYIMAKNILEELK